MNPKGSAKKKKAQLTIGRLQSRCVLHGQDNKDLELELIPNSLSDSDPEVNLSDPSHQVSDEKRRSARKKE